MFAELMVLLLCVQFSEEVSHVCTGHILDVNGAILELFLGVVVLDVYVLGLLVGGVIWPV